MCVCVCVCVCMCVYENISTQVKTNKKTWISFYHFLVQSLNCTSFDSNRNHNHYSFLSG